METIAPPASVMNSLFRRPVGKDEERKKRQGKSFEADHAAADEDDATVIVEPVPDEPRPAVPPAILSYADAVPADTADPADIEAQPFWPEDPAEEPSDPSASFQSSAEAAKAEHDAEEVAAAILLAEEEEASRQAATSANPYGATPANPCGGKTDVEM